MEISEKKLYSFSTQEPPIGAYIGMIWDGGRSDCECIYEGLDLTITPLPSHWYFVDEERKYTKAEVVALFQKLEWQRGRFLPEDACCILPLEDFLKEEGLID